MADFEQANANLATILGKNVKDIEQLTESALNLGRTTEYTASQVTQLQTELAKLGFSEGQIRAMEEPVLHFATGSGRSFRKQLRWPAQRFGSSVWRPGIPRTSLPVKLAFAIGEAAIDYGTLRREQIRRTIISLMKETINF